MAYTYEDFENAAIAAGLLDQFSQYDLNLARQYPEAGLSLVSLKQDYANATTDEQRILINEAANQVRSSYGSYTGGRDGSRYYAEAKPQAQTSQVDSQVADQLGKIGSFGSFNYGGQSAYQKALDDVTGAPGFSFDYGNQGAYQQALDSVANAPGFSFEGKAPTYENPYAQQQQELLDAALNHGDFTWSKETDPLWGSYKKSYLREGDRATANALGQASAASGGRASSYALSAATQAGDYYAAKLNDIIPILYQQAYDRHLQDYQRKLSDLGAVNSQQQLDYARYLDELGQFNTDRNFALTAYNADTQARLNALNALMADRDQQWTEQLGAYNAGTQARLNALDALAADRSQAYNEYQGDFNRAQTYLQDLQGQSDTIYSRALQEESQRLAQQQYADQLKQQELENQIALAKLGASVGDNSGLSGLGIDTSNAGGIIYGYAADGTAYNIGSEKGKYFIENAGPGQTMTGGDGSTWTKNADGSVTIVQNGKTYTVAAPQTAATGTKATGGTGKGTGSGSGGSTGGIDKNLDATLKSLYPDGNVTDPDDWNYLLTLYDEETLNAAGYRHGTTGTAGGATGEQHPSGKPKSEGYDNAWAYIQNLFQTQGKEAALNAIYAAAMTNMISDDEIILIMDQLGIDADAGSGSEAKTKKHGNGGR